MLGVLGSPTLSLPPLCSPKIAGTEVQPSILHVVPQDHPTPSPPQSGPTQHSPLPKELTVLEEASLTTAHLGPGRGGLCLIVFRHQLQRSESQTAERGPCSPLEQGQTVGFFPAKVHLRAHITPSLSLPPLYTGHITSHQLRRALNTLSRGRQGVSSPDPQAPGHGQAQPRGLAHMKIPPTLLPLYKEKTQNSLAHVLIQQTKGKEFGVGPQESQILVSALPPGRSS